jgi:hypothetical protein
MFLNALMVERKMVVLLSTQKETIKKLSAVQELTP